MAAEVIAAESGVPRAGTCRSLGSTAFASVPGEEESGFDERLEPYGLIQPKALHGYLMRRVLVDPALWWSHTARGKDLVLAMVAGF